MCDQDNKIKELLRLKIKSLKQQKKEIEQLNKKTFLILKQERIRRVLGQISSSYEEILRKIILRLSCRLNGGS